MEITPEEIANAHHEHCIAEHRCYRCKYYNCNVKCAYTFALDYITKKSLEKVDNQAENDAKTPLTCKKTAHVGGDINVPTKLPAWCKVGAWVVAKFDLEMNKRVKDCVLKRITEVDSFGGITVDTLKGEHEHDIWSEYVPIIFRPYTYNEAKKLLGKVMETSCGGYIDSEIITRVRRISSDGVTINGTHFDWLAKDYNATIDGLPIGVPVVDDDAMKGE